MSTRVITCTVDNEMIHGCGRVVGAAGSHDDVELELAFSELWAGTSKRIVWFDALGENPVLTDLLPTMLVSEEPETYRVPIPAEAKAIEGDMFLTVRGVILDEDGETEKQATLTAAALFRVLPSRWDPGASEAQDITPSQAEQILAMLDAMRDDIRRAGEAAGSAEAAARSALQAEAARDAAQGAADSAAADALRAEAARDGVDTARAEALAAADRAEASAAASAESAGLSLTAAEQAVVARRAAEEAAAGVVAVNTAAIAALSGAAAAEQTVLHAAAIATEARMGAETARDEARASAAAAAASAASAADSADAAALSAARAAALTGEAEAMLLAWRPDIAFQIDENGDLYVRYAGEGVWDYSHVFLTAAEYRALVDGGQTSPDSIYFVSETG